MGAQRNNEIKVGPREREYTRITILPSPLKLRCLSPLLVLLLSVGLRHGNENELDLHPC